MRALSCAVLVHGVLSMTRPAPSLTVGSAKMPDLADKLRAFADGDGEPMPGWKQRAAMAGQLGPDFVMDLTDLSQPLLEEPGSSAGAASAEFVVPVLGAPAAPAVATAAAAAPPTAPLAFLGSEQRGALGQHTVGSDAAVGDSVFVFSSGLASPGDGAAGGDASTVAGAATDAATGVATGAATGATVDESFAAHAPVAPPLPTADASTVLLSEVERRVAASELTARGAAASERRDWHAAHSSFSRALSLLPGDSLLMGNWALSLGGIGEHAAMEGSLHRMVRLFPAQRKDVLVTLGRLLTEQQRHAEALVAFRRAAEAATAAAAPDTASDWVTTVNIATSLNLLRDTRCFDHYLAALRLDPTAEGTWNNLGSAMDSMTVPRRVSRTLEREFGVGALERATVADRVSVGAAGRGAAVEEQEEEVAWDRTEEDAGSVQWDKAEACFTRMQELAVRALNARIKEANHAARTARAAAGGADATILRPRCLMRVVSDWDRGTEPGVTVTPYLPPAGAGNGDSADPVDVVAEAAARTGVGVGWGSGGGYMYGTALPSVLDPSELHGFRLSASPERRFHSMMYTEKRVFTAVFALGAGALVAGKAGVVQDSCRAFLDSHGGYVWLDATRGFPAREDLPLVRLERAASIVQMSGNLFFHWLLECLPRLLLLKSLLERDASIALLVPSGLNRVTESLALLGWPLRAPVPGRDESHGALVERRIVYYEPERACYAIGELHVADWRAVDERPTQAFTAPRVALVAVRAALAPPPPLAELLWREREQQRGGRPLRLVYTSRRGDLMRKDKQAPRIVVNEDALVAALVAAMPGGAAEVSVVHGGEITMAETVALFKAADIVVGAFGGTLANIVFCAPRTQVLEIALREPAYRTYMHLAAAMGLGYWVTTDTPDNSFADALEAPIEKVRDIVEHIVSTRVG